MQGLLNRQRIAQLKLFRPRHRSPVWEGLPQDIRLRAVSLVAQLLREHSRRVHAPGSRKEAGNE
jgi:hypothetical protein